MEIDPLLPQLVDVGGVVLIAALVVWRVEKRLASIEREIRNLAVEIHKMVWKLGE